MSHEEHKRTSGSPVTQDLHHHQQLQQHQQQLILLLQQQQYHRHYQHQHQHQHQHQLQLRHQHQQAQLLEQSQDYSYLQNSEQFQHYGQQAPLFTAPVGVPPGGFVSSPYLYANPTALPEPNSSKKVKKKRRNPSTQSVTVPDSSIDFPTPSNLQKQQKRISCTSCRRRKIKCDNQTPICGACQKKNLPEELCIYDNAPWISTVVKEKQMHDEINDLKQRNENLLRKMKLVTSRSLQLQKENELLKQQSTIPSVLDPQTHQSIYTSGSLDSPADRAFALSDEDGSSHKSSSLTDFAQSFPFGEQFNTLQVIDIDDDNSSSATVPVFSGPTSWKSAISVDKKIKFIYDKLLLLINSEKENAGKSASPSLLSGENHFGSNSLDNKTKKNDNGGQNSDTTLLFQPILSNSKNRYSLGEIRNFLHPFLSRLPQPCEIRLHIENFFCGFACNVLPEALSKDELYSNFEEVFGFSLYDCSHPPGTSNGVSYQINKLGNFTTFTKISRILLVIKFSQLFGLNDFKSTIPITLLDRFPFFFSTDDVKKCFYAYMDNHPHYNILNMVHLCLNLGRYMDKPSIPTLHTLTMLFLYNLFGPEFYNGLYHNSGSSHLVLACNMAMEMGLHKNIDVLYSYETVTTRRRLKAIWALLLGYDGRRSLVSGLPLCINENYTSNYKIMVTPASADQKELDDETFERNLIITTLAMSREIMSDLLKEENKTTLNLKLQIEKLECLKTKYYSSSLSEHLERLNTEDRSLSEKQIHFRIRQIKNYLHIYALYQTIYQMLYLAYDNSDDPRCKEYRKKYFILTMKYSVLIMLSILEVFKIFDKISRVYNANYEKIYYLLPVIKECEIRASLFILSIILGDLQSLKETSCKRNITSIDDLIHERTVLDLTLSELENSNVDQQPEELQKMSKMFTNDNTFIMLKFLYVCLNEIWKRDKTATLNNSAYAQTLKLFHYFMLYIVEKFEGFKYDLSFMNKNFVYDALRASNPYTPGNLPLHAKSINKTFTNDIDARINSSQISRPSPNTDRDEVRKPSNYPPSSTDSPKPANPSEFTPRFSTSSSHSGPLLSPFQSQFSPTTPLNNHSSTQTPIQSCDSIPVGNLSSKQPTSLSEQQTHDFSTIGVSLALNSLNEDKIIYEGDKSKSMLFDELDALLNLNSEQFSEQFKNNIFMKHRARQDEEE